MRLTQRRLWLAVAVGALMCGDVRAQPVVPTQTDEGRWEIEVHGGGLASATPERGTFALPAQGPLVPPTFNRPVSSWYFGDGAFQLNQFPNVRLSGILTPLDGTLQSRMAARTSGGVFGVRLARRLTSRFSAELTVDYAAGPLSYSSDATSAVEAARASFITAFNGLLTAPFIASRTVNSTATITDDEGAQVLTTGAVCVEILTSRRWAPYVVAGLGRLSIRGDAPRVVLTGTYQAFFASPGLPIPPSTLSQTDAITVTSTMESGAVWVLGGGVRLSMSDRWGIRIDVRDHLHGNTLTTRLSAAPALPPSNFTYITSILNNPPLIFSGNSLTPSTLSVPLTDFVTFSGTGVMHQVGLTTGLAWRF